MKKGFVVLIMLCFGAFGGIFFVWSSLNQNKTDIRMKERVLYGDSKEAEELVFTSQANLSNQLFWRTEHILGGQDLCKTEFTTDFSQDILDVSEEAHRKAEDYFHLDWGYQGRYWSDGEFIEQLVQENDISGWYTKTFRLQDEYPYYPVEIQLSLGSLQADFGSEVSENHKKMLRQLEQELAAYFHVPIYEDTLRLVIKADEEGDFSVYVSDATCGMSEKVSSQCIVADQAIWFTFSSIDGVSDSMTKKYLDGLPEGAGVYRLPYRTEEGIPHFETDKLEQVYSISADTVFYDSVVDENAHRILIHTQKSGKQFLSVLSSDTGACVQEIPMESIAEDETVTLRCKDGAVLIYSYNQLIVLDGADGKYSISLDVDATNKLEDVVTDNWDFAWKEGKLAILTTDNSGVYYVFVYNSNGLSYQGKYMDSLTLRKTWKKRESSVILYDNEKMSIQWSSRK